MDKRKLKPAIRNGNMNTIKTVTTSEITKRLADKVAEGLKARTKQD